MPSISRIMARFEDFLKTRLKKFKRSHFEEIQKLDEDLVFGLKTRSKLPSWRQLRYVGKFYSERETLVTKLALLVLLLAMVALGGIVYRNHLEIGPATGGEYVEAIIGAPTYINPLFAQTNDVDQDLSRLIFSSLMKTDAAGQLIGDLAESYEIDETEKIYTITLKEGVRWHDGEPLTARDVVFTVTSMQNQAFRSPLYATFRNVQIRQDSDRHVSFILPEPFAPFLSVLTFGIIPEHLWSQVDPAHAILAELNLKPVGSGPYRFESLAKDRRGNIRSYTLERFGDYYGEGPYLKTLTLKFFSSFDEARQALEDGNADGLGFLPQHYGALQIDEGDMAIEHFSLPQYTALFFNQEANSALADKNVRTALSLATSRRQIIELALPELATPAHGPILPGFVGYDASAEQTIFDPSEAERVLDGSTWARVYPEGESEGRYSRARGTGSNAATLELTLTTIQKEDNIKVAEAIRELWQAVGITVNLNIVDLSQFQNSVIKPRAYEVLLFGQIVGRDPDPYPFWHSSQANDPGLNLARYANKEADRLLEDARRTSNEDMRHEKYLAFQKLLAADIPAIFLYSLDYTYVLPKNIKGIHTLHINQPSDRFSNIASWYVKTKKRINFNF